MSWPNSGLQLLRENRHDRPTAFVKILWSRRVARHSVADYGSRGAVLLLNPADRELFRRIWRLTWPMIVYNALEMAVGFVDLLLVRPFGPAATAALGLSRQVAFVVEAAAAAIAAGVLTLVSQAIGARSVRQVEQVVRQGFWLVLLLGIPMTAVGSLLSRPLLVWMNASAETVAQGEPYLHVYFGGIVFLWGNLVGTAIFRGLGDVWTPLKLILGVSLLHVVLSYLLIYGAGPLPAFQVRGAALGLVIARACGALAYLVLLRRGTRRLQRRVSQDILPNGEDAGPATAEGWRLDWRLIGRMLRIGVPMALANVLRHGSRLMFLAIVGASALGVTFHAAVGVGMQMRLLGVLPALAFQTAAATLVGQAIGRGDYAEAGLLGRRSVQLLALLMTVIVGAVLLLADPLADLFIDSPAAAQLGAKVLRWFAVAQFFSTLSIGTQGALMGAGDTVPALRYTLVSEWALMLPSAYLCLAGGWIPDAPLAAWTLAPALTLVLMQRRWRGGKWRAVRA